jgi:hypothetical protein
MLLYFKSGGESELGTLDKEMLSQVQERVRNSDTREEVDSQLMDLLDNLTISS